MLKPCDVGKVGSMLLGGLLSCFVAVAGGEQVCTSDSIFIDGRVIRVQASVELDTVSRPRRWQFGWNVPGPDERRPVKRRVPAWNGVEVWSRAAVGGGDGTRLEVFDAGRPAVGGGLAWSHVAPRPGRRAWGLGGQIQAQWMPTTGFSESLPDSLIGFLPAERGTVQAVTWERFDLGVETDTLAIGLERSTAWGWAAAGLLRVELQPHTAVSLAFGLERWSRDRTTWRVAEPALDRDPVLAFTAPGAQWHPLARVALEHYWGRRGSAFRGRWGLGVGATWRPAEPDPLSIQLRLGVALGRH